MVLRRRVECNRQVGQFIEHVKFISWESVWYVCVCIYIYTACYVSIYPPPCVTAEIANFCLEMEPWGLCHSFFILFTESHSCSLYVRTLLLKLLMTDLRLNINIYQLRRRNNSATEYRSSCTLNSLAPGFTIIHRQINVRK